VRRALAIVPLVVAAAVAVGLPAGSSGAQSSRQAVVEPDWLTPEGLESDDGRLKRSPVVVAPVLPVANGWRQPSELDLTPRPEAWRTEVITPAPEPAPAAPEPAAATDYDAAVVAATNEIRAKHGLTPLDASPRLEASAELHSRNMGRLGFFAHESADGTVFWKRVQQFYGPGGYSYWSVGENLIWSSPDLSVDAAMNAWMESPGHRENILDRDWREIGCFSVHLDSAPGVYGGRRVVIITCDFGVRR
jgi:uncharacterized protein YkwD